MGCLLLIVSVFMPRIVMALVFIFSGWFGRAYDTVLWPLLGFFFMPYTTLAYMIAMLNNNHQLTGGWLVLVIVAAVIDLTGQGGTMTRR